MRMCVTRVDIELRRWCELQVEIRHRPTGEFTLSICGCEGYVLTPSQARKESQEFWESYFDEGGGAITELNERFGKNCRTSAGAARFVREMDGEYAGLDVHLEGCVYRGKPRSWILTTHSCGQIRSALSAWFRGIDEFFPYHLEPIDAPTAFRLGVLVGRFRTDKDYAY